MYQSMLVRSNRSALAKFSAIFALALAGGGLLIAPSMALAAANVTEASEGTNVSIDTTVSGGSGLHTELSGPVITENAPGDISVGTHTITLPSGWEFDTSSTVTVFRTVGNIQPSSQSAVMTSNTLTFTITSPSTSNSSLAFIFNSMKVRPTGTVSGTTGNMTYSGDGIEGVTDSTNFGTLSTVAGTVTKLAFTTQPSATTVYGSTLSQQPVVKTQDQFGNYSSSGASGKTVTLSLAPDTGNLVGTASLDISSGTASFSGLTVDMVGTKQLTAMATGLASANSSTFEITQKELTVSGLSATSRPYDGTTSAEVTGTPSLVGFVDGDDVSVFGTANGPFDSANVGSRTVIISGLSLSGVDSANYTLTQPILDSSITAKVITVTPNSGQTKIYGGVDPTFTYTNTSLVGEDSITGVLGRNAGEDVDEFSYTLNTLSAGSNYSLILGGSETFMITQRTLAVTATGVNKTYDASTTATVNLSDDRVGGDEITLGYTAVFSDNKNVGNGKPVSVTGISITSGADAGNYTLNGVTTGATTANITPESLTVSFTTDANKTYNGNATADITGRSLVGVINPEIVGVTGGSASFADKDVGPSKTVTATGFTLTGADKDNYVIGTINTTTGNVNPRPITITAQTDTKIYDATADSVVTPVITSSFSPAVATVDSALFTQAYNNKNVGTGKTLTPSGTVTDGNGGANYTITPVSVSTGEITQAPLTATVIVEKKVIDGDNLATITSVTLNGILLSDVVTVNSPGTATFANATVGTHSVSATGVTITGGDAGNYEFDGTATGTGNILAVPTVVYVDDNWATGIDEWEDPDGIGPATYFGYDAFATIQEAIEAVASSGTVNVAAGTYVESVTINKSLTIQRGAGALTKPIIQANDSWGFKLLGATNITVDGFEIQITGGGSANDQAVRLENADGAVIKNNTIATTADTALGIWTCGTDSGCASSDNVNINNNAITIGGVATGIYAEQVNGAHTGWSITDNIIVANAGVPLELYDVTDSTVDDNTLDGSTTNSNTIWSSQRADISDLVFTNNIVSDSSGSMVAFLSDFLLLGDGLDNTVISDVDISGNTFQDWGARGLRIGSGVTTVTVNENKFLGTGEALKNEDAASVNAEENWWGTAVVATIDSKTNGTIDFEPYYVGSGMNILSSVAVNTAYVDSVYSDGAENGGHYFGYDAFATIQEGIDAVASSGTVNVAAGTYNEQLQINKDITVSGATGATIQPTGNDDAWDIQFTTGGSGATLQGFTMDFNGLTDNRPGRGIGVSDQGGPTVTNVTIQNNDITMGVGIGANTAGLEGVGIQTGLNADVSGLLITGNQFHGGSAVISDGNLQGEEGIYINPNSGTGSITISNNTFDGQLFTGISVESDNVTLNNNTVTRTSIVQNTNGIRVNDFVGGKSYDVTLTNNTVSGFANGFRFGSVPDGGSTLAISLTDNTISNNTRGVWVRYDATVTASGNSITGNTTSAEILDGSDGSLSAEGNWWGQSTGPADGAVIGTVDYRPWCTNGACSPIDSTSPTVTVDTLLTNDTTPTITGTVVESNAVTVTITVNSQNYVAVVTSGTWSANVTNELTAGTYSVTATAEDLAGNIGTDATNSELQIDLTAPTVTLTEDHADTIVRDADTVVVTATFNEAMASSPTITINAVADDVTGVAMTNTSGNIWTYSWNVPAGNDGSAVVTVSGTDTAGNAYVGTDSLTFTIDNTAPAVAITQPTADSRVNAAKVITFTDGESTTPQCSIDNSVWVTCTSGTTTLGNVTGFGALTDGNVTLYLRDTDTAGNIGTASVALVKDTSAPIVDSHTPSINAVNVETDTITIVFNEAVNVSTGQITVSPATAVTISSGSGTDTITLNTPSLESNTVYTVTVTTSVEDLAGNAIAEYDWSFTTATLYNVALNAGNGGWNLISLPIVPIDTDISTVLGDAEDSILAVWTYDPTSVYADLENDGWFVYYPDNATLSSPSFESMTAGYGYWISVTEGTNISGSGSLLTAGPTLPPSRTLASGWNLVGYYQIPGDDYSSMEDAFSSIGVATLDYTSLWGFDNTEGEFTGVNQTSPDAILPGEAFWIAVSPNGGKNYTPSNL